MTYKEWMAARERIAYLLACFPTVNGCGDGNCRIKKPTGMHTNGGCRCYRTIAELGLELASLAEPIAHIVAIKED